MKDEKTLEALLLKEFFWGNSCGKCLLIERVSIKMISYSKDNRQLLNLVLMFFRGVDLDVELKLKKNCRSFFICTVRALTISHDLSSERGNTARFLSSEISSFSMKRIKKSYF
jgi:hypothetical protein